MVVVLKKPFLRSIFESLKRFEDQKWNLNEYERRIGENFESFKFILESNLGKIETKCKIKMSMKL